MNCNGLWRKFIFSAFATVLFLCGAALGQTCGSDSVDTSANNANVSLNDYAVIFADAATNCAAKADVALRIKLQNIIGLDLNYPNHHSDLQGRDGLLPFQGWLEGADVAMIFASATRLANAGISDPTLDQYLLKVRDLFLATLDGQNKLISKANGCGITTNARLTGDACMDDYTVAAAGFAWTAAYERWKLRPNAAAISGARALLQKAFSTDESICVVDPGIDTPTPVTPDANGPCIPLPSSFTPEIIQRFNDKTYQVVSLNHGTRDSLAYGIGLMTSVSTAMVGLKIAGVSVDNTNVLERYFTLEQRLIARALWEGAQSRTAIDGSVFQDKCWYFVALGNNSYRLFDDTACDDRAVRSDNPHLDDPTANSNPNVPGMYPVNQFYATFIFGDVVPQQSTGFDFSFVGEPAFDSLFNTPFYGPGRRTYYGQMGWDAGLAATLIPPSLTRRRAVSHSVPPALVSSPYSFSVLDPAADVEIPLSYQVNGTLPPGISFSGVTGMFSGTAPPSPGIFDFAINAVYVDGGTLPQEYALPVCQSTLASANVAVNVPLNSFFSTIPLNSNPLHLLTYDVVAGGLPPGALLDENTGVVSGAANLPGTYGARVRATLRPSGTVVLAACPAGTTTDLFYQISVGCGAGCQPQYEGYNDGLNTDNVWGWAWDKSFPASPIQVDIYDSGFDVVPFGTPLLARVNANLFRQDLRDAGKGDGNHAFVFLVPDALKDGNAHRIHVTFAGTKTDLSWSPRILVPSSGRFVGAHSTNACDRIDGFALDNWQPNTPIDVNIFDNGVLLASLVANYDSTVVPATAGNGTHGFLYYTPDHLKDGNFHQITITFRLSGQQLSTTNRTLSCPATPPPSTPVWEGFFDSVTCERVDGWGWDKNRPNTPVDMGLFADGTQVATLTANYFSQDLVDAGKGNGAHRYLYYLPDFLKDGGQHHVTAQIIGQGTDLPVSSPNTTGNITCPALPAPVAPPFHPITNTSAGPGSTASSGPATGSTPGVDVTFNSVSFAGVTSFILVDSTTLPQLPDGYAYPHAAINPMAFDISTTAGYSGPVAVTFTILSETDPTEFSLLRILHLEGGVWQDRTSLPSDMSTHRVTALVGSFSPFVIARLIQRPVITSVGITSSGSSVYGQSVGFTARVYGLGNGTVPTGTVTFLDGNQVLGTVQVDGSSQAVLNTTLVNAGTRFISASYSGDFVFPPNSGQVIQIVTPAALSVSASSASRSYGVGNPVFSGTLSGLQNNDSIPTTFQSGATPSSPVGTYAITAVFSDPGGKLSNYTTAVQNGVLTVTAAPLSVSANPASRFYGDPNPALTGTISGLMNSDNITAAYQSSANAASVPGTYSITAALSDPGGRLSNYSVSQGSGVLTVQPAALQVTANNKTRMYGDPNPVFDGTITGLRNSDNIQAQYSTTATAQSLVGNYPIVPTLSDPTGKLGNYTVTLQNGTLSITRSTIHLAFPSFNPSSGTYAPGQTVTITEATSSAAAIHYTTDGTTPTSTSPLYTGPIALNLGSASITFKAMATQPEYIDSGVSLAGYSIRIPISATPASQTILGCGSASYTVSVPAVSALSGSSLTLSVSGVPTGATASLGPPSIGSPGSSTLTVTPSSSTPAGNYSLTISVATGNLIGSTTVTMNVQDFGVSVTSPSQAITAGGSTSYAVATTVTNGFAGSIALSMSGLPAGTSAAFNPISINGAGPSSLIVTTSSSTPLGTYTPTLAASNGCRVRPLPLTLVVNAPPPSGPNITGLSPVTGPVGTAVTISGSGFGTTQGTVTFNGTAAQPTAWSAGSISTSVPRGAKTGNVVVTVGGAASNGVTFTVQDDAVHIFGTNCSTCGWQTTDFTIQTSTVYGYTIRSGDILYFYQWQSVGSVAGLEVCFPGGEGVSCADNGLTVDQDNKPVHADTITGATHFRRVDLSPNAGQPLSQISFHSHGTTKAGRWDVYFSNIQIVSADGSVRSIFVTGSTPSLFMTSSFGVTQLGSAVEHAHVW